MTKIFTENDLLRFIYGETSKAENLAIHDAILCDPGMQEKLNELQEMKTLLEAHELSPGSKVVNNILSYSKNFGELPVSK